MATDGLMGWQHSWTKPHLICLLAWLVGPAGMLVVRVYLALVHDGRGEVFRSHPEALLGLVICLGAGGLLFAIATCFPVRTLPEYWSIVAFWLLLVAQYLLVTADLEVPCGRLLMDIVASVPLFLTLMRVARSLLRRRHQSRTPSN